MKISLLLFVLIFCSCGKRKTQQHFIQNQKPQKNIVKPPTQKTTTEQSDTKEEKIQNESINDKDGDFFSDEYEIENKMNPDVADYPELIFEEYNNLKLTIEDLQSKRIIIEEKKILAEPINFSDAVFKLLKSSNKIEHKINFGSYLHLPKQFVSQIIPLKVDKVKNLSFDLKIKLQNNKLFNYPISSITYSLRSNLDQNSSLLESEYNALIDQTGSQIQINSSVEFNRNYLFENLKSENILALLKNENGFYFKLENFKYYHPQLKKYISLIELQDNLKRKSTKYIIQTPSLSKIVFASSNLNNLKLLKSITKKEVLINDNGKIYQFGDHRSDNFVENLTDLNKFYKKESFWIQHPNKITSTNPKPGSVYLMSLTNGQTVSKIISNKHASENVISTKNYQNDILLPLTKVFNGDKVFIYDFNVKKQFPKIKTKESRVFYWKNIERCLDYRYENVCQQITTCESHRGQCRLQSCTLEKRECINKTLDVVNKKHCNLKYNENYSTYLVNQVIDLSIIKELVYFKNYFGNWVKLPNEFIEGLVNNMLVININENLLNEINQEEGLTLSFNQSNAQKTNLKIGLVNDECPVNHPPKLINEYSKSIKTIIFNHYYQIKSSVRFHSVY